MTWTFQAVEDLQHKLPAWLPLDGVAVTAMAWFLSPLETRLRNAVVIGATHGLLHASVVEATSVGLGSAPSRYDKNGRYMTTNI